MAVVPRLSYSASFVESNGIFIRAKKKIIYLCLFREELNYLGKYNYVPVSVTKMKHPSSYEVPYQCVLFDHLLNIF